MEIQQIYVATENQSPFIQKDRATNSIGIYHPYTQCPAYFPDIRWVFIFSWEYMIGSDAKVHSIVLASTV